MSEDSRSVKSRKTDLSALERGSLRSEDTVWELQTGHEKWKRLRRGTVIEYVPFEVEPDSDDEFHDLPTPTFDPDAPLNNTKNWPSTCPIVRVAWEDFPTKGKRKYAIMTYRYWKCKTIKIVLQSSLMSSTREIQTVSCASCYLS